MNQQWQDWAAASRDVAQQAGEDIAASIGGKIQVRYKAPRDPVTEVDERCQALIRERLLGANPQHGFLGEEGNSTRLDAEYVWVVDPLDGTKNFSHGYPVVAVSIGLQHRGKMVVGVVHDALRRETFCAVRGEGAYLNGERIRVSDRGNFDEALLVTGFAARLDLEYDIFRTLDKLTQGVRRDGSAALDLCAVAAGRLDGYFQLNLSPWDVAAGALIVEEAEGMITDYRGGQFRIDGRQAIASNVKLHKGILDAVAPRVDEIERTLGARSLGRNI